MKIFISLILVLFCLGCANETQNRQQLVNRFQAAYPNNWQQKLLEYDIEQGNLKSNEPNFVDYWQAFLKAREQNIQRHPPVIISPQIINPALKVRIVN